MPTFGRPNFETKMGKSYGQEAIELCRKLYCKYGGKNYDAIEREMRREYPGWSKTNLDDKWGRDRRHHRFGWRTKYGFDNSLKLHLQKLVESVNDDEQDLYLGIKAVRKELQKTVSAGVASRDEFYQYRDFCRLEIEARKNLDLSRDNLETFVAGYEKLVIWLGEIDKAAAKMLVKHGDRLAEMAKAHYGKAETEFDGSGDRADEGGHEPFSPLT